RRSCLHQDLLEHVPAGLRLVHLEIDESLMYQLANLCGDHPRLLSDRAPAEAQASTLPPWSVMPGHFSPPSLAVWEPLSRAAIPSVI
ncbi:MAG: hypothetical protein ACO2YY_10350, partial [Pseudohongiellaceae bacterium]